MKLLVLILGRTAFLGLLLFFSFVGIVSLVGYPGPFVLTAFSMAGLPAWVLVRSTGRIMLLSLALAAAASVIPVMLLIVYTRDGDFTVPEVIVHISVLVLFAWGLSCLGLGAGRFVWLARGD